MAILQPKYIVVHTAAFSGRNCDRDRIDQWHRDRGWQGIGYHFVIANDKHDTLADGTLQTGRDITIPGAHALGINSKSIGICCAGHGDKDAFTEAQQTSLIELISRLIDDYEDIVVDRVIGHHELNDLVAKGELSDRYRTSKTCPGNLVSMTAIREAVRTFRSAVIEAEVVGPEPNEGELREALAMLEAGRKRFPNAGEPLTEFLTHPEVLEFRNPG